MRKLVLSILMLGFLLMFAGSVSAQPVTCSETPNGHSVSCDSDCRVHVIEPVNGDYYDPVTIKWDFTGNCIPSTYTLQYQVEQNCEGLVWTNIIDGLASDEIPMTYDEWDPLALHLLDGPYCIRVRMNQAQGDFVSGYSGTFYLDLTDPVLTISVGDEKVIDGEDTYVNTQTPITLSCTDDGEYHSDVDYIEYSINGGEWTTYVEPFTFSEDSNHTLEARCFDNVGKEDTQSKDFIVDSVGPVVYRTVGEPKIPTETEGNYYVTEDTEICVDAMNGESEPHPVPGEFTISCEGVQLDDNNCFHYTEDSQHTLYCSATDALLNPGSSTWADFVESQAPVTTISYEGPQYPIENPKYIDDVSTVVLTASDGETHPSGVDTTYYRYYIVDDKYCSGTQDEFTAPEAIPSFTVYEAPFSMDKSCHAIEYYSVDNLGNEETVKRSFIFVDTIAPLTDKVVGKPNHKCTVGDSQCEEGWDYVVTVNTPITLSCEDQLPHPSGISKLCYQITLDGDAQEEVCEYTDEVVVHFPEESEHQLDFYCVDNVNKISALYSEMFKVEGEEFIIEELKEKWNLISIPFNLLSNDVEEVFSQISDKVEIVWNYDEDGWHVYSPEGPSDLTEIKPGYGYWVKATEDTSLVVGGSLLSPAPGIPPSRPLQKGWNLIGRYGLTEDQTASCAFSL